MKKKNKREDLALSNLANNRDTNQQERYSHEQAWIENAKHTFEDFNQDALERIKNIEQGKNLIEAHGSKDFFKKTE